MRSGQAHGPVRSCGVDSRRGAFYLARLPVPALPRRLMVRLQLSTPSIVGRNPRGASSQFSFNYTNLGEAGASLFRSTRVASWAAFLPSFPQFPFARMMNAQPKRKFGRRPQPSSSCRDDRRDKLQLDCFVASTPSSLGSQLPFREENGRGGASCSGRSSRSLPFRLPGRVDVGVAPPWTTPLSGCRPPVLSSHSWPANGPKITLILVVVAMLTSITVVLSFASLGMPVPGLF